MISSLVILVTGHAIAERATAHNVINHSQHPLVAWLYFRHVYQVDHSELACDVAL